MNEYFLMLSDKDTGEVKFYNERTVLRSSFAFNFEMIIKTKNSLDNARALKECLDDLDFTLNRYFFR